MSVQLENGFTRIANELLEALMNQKIHGREFRVLLAIIRKTYGFGKKEDQIPLSQFTEMTGLDRKYICDVLNSLENKKMIIRNNSVSPTRYSLTKDYSIWDCTLQGNKVVPQEVINQSPVRYTQKKERNTKEITPNGDKLKPMKYEQIIELDEDGEIKPIKSTLTKFGKYPARIAMFYCELVGKTSASRQLPASKELLQLAQKDFPDDTLEQWETEIKARIKVAQKHYVMNNISDWNLSKVAENWNNIIQWSSKLK